MKGILVLGLMAALVVAPGGSLDCPQCSSFDSSCDDSVVSECPPDASTSCVVSYASWPAVQPGLRAPHPDSPPTRFQDLACSNIDAALLATTGSEALRSFYVRVADGQTAWLESQFCNGGPCSNTSLPPPVYPPEGTGDTQCPACIAVNDASCEESYVRCNPGERCVDVVVIVVQGTGDNVLFTLLVKGCSDITDELCGLLSTPNIRIGNIIFQQLSCSDAVPIPNNLNSGAALAAAP